MYVICIKDIYITKISYIFRQLKIDKNNIKQNLI